MSSHHSDISVIVRPGSLLLLVLVLGVWKWRYRNAVCKMPQNVNVVNPFTYTIRWWHGMDIVGKITWCKYNGEISTAWACIPDPSRTFYSYILTSLNRPLTHTTMTRWMQTFPSECIVLVSMYGYVYWTQYRPTCSNMYSRTTIGGCVVCL